jgi:RHS repeat-associated protein
MRVIQERDGNNTPTVSYTRLPHHSEATAGGIDLSGSLEGACPVRCEDSVLTGIQQTALSHGAGGIGGLLARSSGYSSGNFTTHNYYFADGNGNVTYMLNSSQAMVASYRYDPFGNTISSSGTLASANVYRFSSKEIHANSGMYYYGYRFYDPNLQRWINRDPVAETGFETLKFQRSNFSLRIAVFERHEGVNLYEFVQNEPTLRYDSLGLVSLACLSAMEQAEAANAALAAAISAGDWEATPGLAQAAIAALSNMAAACSDPPPPPPGEPVTVPVKPTPTPPPKSWWNRCLDFKYHMFI